MRVGVVGPEAQNDVDGSTLAEIAAAHEYGTAVIPQRSWIRRTFTDQLDELKGMQTKLSKALLDGKMDVLRAMSLLGTWGAAAIKATVTQGRVTPKLEESAAGLRTIERKGSSQTLIDTGQMVNSVTWVVDK